MLEELPVIRIAGEVATAAEHQLLLDGSFKTIMALLHISVLVCFPGLNLLPDHPVIAQQSFVAIGELCRIRDVIHRRGHPVRPMPSWDFPQFPDRVLKTFT